MGIMSMWREARGHVMRKEFDDVMARLHNANASAMSAFLRQIEVTIDPMVEIYVPATSRVRRDILVQSRNIASDLWDRGDWPSALGSAIVCLNVESQFVPGADANFVRVETERLIAKARAA